MILRQNERRQRRSSISRDQALRPSEILNKTKVRWARGFVVHLPTTIENDIGAFQAVLFLVRLHWFKVAGREELAKWTICNRIRSTVYRTIYSFTAKSIIFISL